MKKAELAAAELKAPAMANPNTTGADKHDAKKDEKARKAQISSLRKRATGARRERLVPPDFARLPISVMRSMLGR
jgi:hypothetical protein